jgi:hypothetical protein
MAYVTRVPERRIIKVPTPKITTASAVNLLGLLFLVQLVMKSDYIRNFSKMVVEGVDLYDFIP